MFSVNFQEISDSIYTSMDDGLMSREHPDVRSDVSQYLSRINVKKSYACIYASMGDGLML